jgi:hypothetical protein
MGLSPGTRDICCAENIGLRQLAKNSHNIHVSFYKPHAAQARGDIKMKLNLLKQGQLPFPVHKRQCLQAS